MRGLKTAAVAAALVAAVVGYRWWTSPERQIRRVLDEIAARLSHDEPRVGLDAVGALAGLQEVLAPDVAIEGGAPLPPLEGRDAVLAGAARLLSTVPALRVEIADPRITVAADSQSAQVACYVTATRRDADGRDVVDGREVTIEMRVVNGRWTVRRAVPVNVIEPVT